MDDSLERAIREHVEIVSYDPRWPDMFAAERERLRGICPELAAVEHVGSTAVVGLSAKPVVDLMGAVASMKVADVLVERLCGMGGAGAGGYVTSAEFNATLNDRRWLMRHAQGRRTHHLHLVVAGSEAWRRTILFRDLLRKDGELARAYVEKKRQLARAMGADREGYTAAKGAFIEAVLGRAELAG
jgi:GrpB-like predicted nucleotidyltransferase (UPF0157 family)